MPNTNPTETSKTERDARWAAECQRRANRALEISDWIARNIKDDVTDDDEDD